MRAATPTGRREQSRIMEGRGLNRNRNKYRLRFTCASGRVVLMKNVNKDEFVNDMFFYSFLIVSIIGLILSPIMFLILYMLIGFINANFLSSFSITWITLIISIIIGLASIIFGNIKKENDDRYFNILLIGILTIILCVLSGLAILVDLH